MARTMTRSGWDALCVLSDISYGKTTKVEVGDEAFKLCLSSVDGCANRKRSRRCARMQPEKGFGGEQTEKER